MITFGLNEPTMHIAQGLNGLGVFEVVQPPVVVLIDPTTVIKYPPQFPPPAEKLPFDSSGRLLPDGPKWGAPWRADDIQVYITRRQWLRRLSQDAWMNPTQRQLVLVWLTGFFASGLWGTWHIEERNTDNTSSLTFSRRPRIIITVTTKTKPVRTFTTVVEFSDEVLASQSRFNAVLAGAGAFLIQQAGF